MRDIKFRVYRFLSERMVEWKTLKNLRTLSGFLTNPTDDYYSEAMQFTGIKDRNGKEVYEEDIITISNKETSNRARVTFDDGCFSVIGYLGDLRTFPIRQYLFTGYEIEVIGNVYQNPELLPNV